MNTERIAELLAERDRYTCGLDEAGETGATWEGDNPGDAAELITLLTTPPEEIDFDACPECGGASEIQYEDRGPYEPCRTCQGSGCGPWVGKHTPTPDATAQLRAGQWFVTAMQDEDGHLCLIIRNADGSPVLAIDSTEDDDGPFNIQRRFTSEHTEEAP